MAIITGNEINETVVSHFGAIPDVYVNNVFVSLSESDASRVSHCRCSCGLLKCLKFIPPAVFCVATGINWFKALLHIYCIKSN